METHKRIIRHLMRCKKPKKAKEIVSVLNSRSEEKVNKTDVNRCLYGPLKDIVIKDEYHRWKMIDDEEKIKKICYHQLGIGEIEYKLWPKNKDEE